jgi:hypothetical protein
LKKEAKTFVHLAYPWGATLTPYKQEFFGSFLQEKELLAFCLPHRPGRHW